MTYFDAFKTTKWATPFNKFDILKTKNAICEISQMAFFIFLFS
ncbi:MAG: hypothetical protein RL757_1329 [Bacteroidota bacterium]|jgi:hypothetical protein